MSSPPILKRGPLILSNQHVFVLLHPTSLNVSSHPPIFLEDITSVHLWDAEPGFILTTDTGREYHFKLPTADTDRNAFTLERARQEASAWTKCIENVLGEEIEDTTQQRPMILVEHFNTKGLRVSGPAPLPLLAILSRNVPKSKKRRDARGWYIDCFVPLPTVLALFDVFGWSAERFSETVGVDGRAKDGYYSGGMLPANKTTDIEPVMSFTIILRQKEMLATLEGV